MYFKDYRWRRLATIFSLLATLCASGVNAGTVQDCRIAAAGLAAPRSCSQIAKPCCCATVNAPRACKCSERSEPEPLSFPPTRESRDSDPVGPYGSLWRVPGAGRRIGLSRSPA